MSNELDPAVARFIDAVNAGDRDALFAVLTDDATMSDDGSERDIADWTDKEMFSSNGRMKVESVKDHGRSLVADFTNDTWGTMRTAWRFTLAGERISHFDTGQA
ncbi:nuclear transport factor 2 family protein [Streptomyces sp. NBC_01166]|uniref:nuclear transport factor 2 family protein n=1 Tax=Streptomyces sp. NBC_01166 TaxID=2903755 RepID=UPI003870E837|nr:nuclear transport factor 2 family protein [Streptomyces sp. NBC_01166]